MGRPRKHLHRDDLVKIEDMAARGCSHVRIARASGLDTKTLRDRLEDDPAAAEAFRAGKAEEEDHLIAVLRRKADQGDTGATMFLLRARHGYRDDGSMSAVVSA